MKLQRSMIPDIAALQAFEAAARHASFTRAAEEVNLTQSAVSRQIKELEAQLGVALFNRIRQRVVLTGAGRRLLLEVEQLLAQVEAMTLRAVAARDIAGSLSIASLPTFASRWLMPRLPDFARRHPGVQLSVSSYTGAFDLAERGVDLAIHYGQPIWPGAVCTYLCKEQVVPVAAPDLAREVGRDLTLAPLLQLESRPQLWTDWFAFAGMEAGSAYAGHRFDTFALIIEAALAGLGVALVPAYLIEREVQGGALVVVDGRAMATEPSYFVVVPEGQLTDPLVTALGDWLVGAVGGGGQGGTPPARV